MTSDYASALLGAAAPFLSSLAHLRRPVADDEFEGTEAVCA